MKATNCRTFNDCVDRARLLAEPTVDALGHVNVIAGGAATSIGSLGRLNCDGLEKKRKKFDERIFFVVKKNKK